MKPTTGLGVDNVRRERTDKEDGERKMWGGEWSKGVVRGIIECLRGPRRHWAAGQGEENGVKERNKRLSQ